MARIRTVKPEFFKHEELFEAELETGLPLRLAFIGLWTICDREGRFKWRPRQIKTDVLPYDDCDFSRVLDALLTRGFIWKYEWERVEYGFVPSFTTHQVINNREIASSLPDPESCEIYSVENNNLHVTATRYPRVDDASGTSLCIAQGEGNGKEGKGREVEGDVPATVPVPGRRKSEPNPLNVATWNAYASAYHDRYGVEPVRNATVNGQIANFVKRIGENAPHVAAHYVTGNSSFYLTKGHGVGPMLADAEKLHTEWATGRRVTQSAARQADRSQSNLDNSRAALDLLNEKYGSGA